MDWYLGCYRYRTCIWCIDKWTVPCYDWYIFSRYTRNTVRYNFKRGRVGRVFFHRLIVSPFLKGQIFTGSRQSFCLSARTRNRGCATTCFNGIRSRYRLCLSVITGSTVPSLLNKVCNSIYVRNVPVASCIQNLSDFLGIGIEVLYLNPPPPPPTPSRRPP